MAAACFGAEVDLHFKCAPYSDLLEFRKFREFESRIFEEENRDLLVYFLEHYVATQTGSGNIHCFVIYTVVWQLTKLDWGWPSSPEYARFWQRLWERAPRSQIHSSTCEAKFQVALRQAIWDLGGKSVLPRGTDPYILEDREFEWDGNSSLIFAGEEGRD